MEAVSPVGARSVRCQVMGEGPVRARRLLALSSPAAVPADDTDATGMCGVDMVGSRRWVDVKGDEGGDDEKADGNSGRLDSEV